MSVGTIRQRVRKFLVSAATVWRLDGPSVDSYGATVETYSIAGTVACRLSLHTARPDEFDKSAGGQIRQDQRYDLIVLSTAEVRETDRLELDGQFYTVVSGAQPRSQEATRRLVVQKVIDAFLAPAEWQSRTTPADNDWIGITYGNGLWAAVSETGTADRVMTSPNGITWTGRTTPDEADDVEWRSVAYGATLFVAVARNGTGNKLMTSPDGFAWTTSAAPDNTKRYREVIWVEALGLFVAVGTAGACMTSPDGLTWTERTLPTAGDYLGVAYGTGLLVAVCNFGSDPRITTSPDGINWTARNAPAANAWRSVAFGGGLFVAICNTTDLVTTGQQVMTSPDGLTWTLRATPAEQEWERVAWGRGLFAAVASDPGASTTRVMVSSNGADWSLETTPDRKWGGVAYGNNRFVGVAFSGTGNRAMTRG